MRYRNVEDAIERAMSSAGYDAPVRAPDVAALLGAEYDHTKKNPSDMTREDWLIQNGMTLSLIRRSLGGSTAAQYRALVARYCYEPIIRTKAFQDLAEQHVPARMPKLKRLAVIAIWAGAVRMTYKDVDAGDGTATSTIGRHMNEIREQLDVWHDAAINHLTRVLADADLIEPPALFKTG